ncbi:hypothetical protein [Rhodopseudomonas sp. RCAM05734]|uniref:hypothetical protein n=1 Tax=Rhodopseudomonas sp. RCAM05734 TaxID=3457549 RepID=UPI004044A1E8
MPGFEVAPGGRGHYFDSPKGRCFMSGAMPGDECFHSDRFGQINVSKCQDMFSADSELRALTAPLDKGIIRNISAHEFDQTTVNQMTTERRDEPILMIVSGDGLNVVDGTHRLRRRIQDSCTHFSFYLLHPRVLQMARVRLMRQQSDGSWRQDGGLSNEELEREIAKAEAMLDNPSSLGLRRES